MLQNGFFSPLKCPFLKKQNNSIASLSIELLTKSSQKESYNQKLFKESPACAQQETLSPWLRSQGIPGMVFQMH